MGIKSGNSNDELVLSTDTVLLHPTTGRAVITSAILSEQTGAQETIELFVSSDASSAAAERIEKLILTADETIDPISLPDRSIPDGSYLLAKGGTGSLVTAYITYTQYTGSS